jgi:hypothetical protein
MPNVPLGIAYPALRIQFDTIELSEFNIACNGEGDSVFVLDRIFSRPLFLRDDFGVLHGKPKMKTIAMEPTFKRG